MKNVLVTIISPVFNAEKYLPDFLKCINSQTYKNWELIIVDDGSSDATLEILNRYKKEDCRIKVFKRLREPKGSLTCRNIGLEYVEGKYFIQIDVDDLFSKTFLENRVNLMEEYPDIDYATFPACSVVEKNGMLFYGGNSWGFKQRNLLKLFLNTKYPFSIWNNIYKSESLKNELWDEKVKIYSDFSYAIPIILKGYKHIFSKNKQFDYFYKVGLQNSMTASFISEEKFDSTLYLFNKTIIQLNELGHSRYVKYFSRFFALQFSRLLTNGTHHQRTRFIKFTFDHGFNHLSKRMKKYEVLCSYFENKGMTRCIHWASVFFANKFFVFNVLFKKTMQNTRRIYIK